MFSNFLLVGLGGGIGSMLRYGTYRVMNAGQFPIATFTVNIAGSFLIGLIAGLSLKNAEFAGNWKLFLATGICGGFTTFSAFSADNLQLLQNGRYLTALLYTLASAGLGLAAAFGGFKLMQ